MVSSHNLLTQYIPYFDVNSKHLLFLRFSSVTLTYKSNVQKIADSLNLLRILLVYIIHGACRVDKKFRNATKSVIFQIIKGESIFA